jgi:hypothetical protein
MEHKKDNDYLKEFLSDENSGDFDSLLKEKLKGWTAPTESQILQEQKLVPTRVKPTVESVVVDSQNTSNSNGTGEHGESSEPSVAEPVVSPTEAEIAIPTTDPTTEPIKSDPEFTRQIIEGKVQQHTIRGIKTGPWAKQEAVVKILPQDEVLRKLGLPSYADIWKNARNFYVRKAGNDVDESQKIKNIIDHINHLEGAAFRMNLMIETGKELLKERLAGLSEEERKIAEIQFSKIYREKGDRSKLKVKKGDGEKSEPKARELNKKVKDGLDTLFALGATYDMIIAKLKVNPPKDSDLQLDYIKRHFGKA